MIRSNPNNLNIKLENVNKPSIIYDTNDNLLNEVIKPLSNTNKITLGIINPKFKLDNTLHNPISGLRQDFVKIDDDRRDSRENDTTYLILEPTKGIFVAHRVFISSMYDKKIENKEYKDYAEKSVEFIKKELIKLISVQLEDSERLNIVKNLSKLTITKDDYLKQFENNYDNITITCVDPFDVADKKSSRFTKVKIQLLENGKYMITESVLNENDKETVDTSKAAKLNNKSIVVSSLDLMNSLDNYVPRMLRNFDYNKTKIDLSNMNDGYSNDNTRFFDPLDRYEDENQTIIKKSNRNEIIDDGTYGNPYLKFAIEKGNIKTNIGAIKSNNKILSNYDMSYDARRPLVVHINATQKEGNKDLDISDLNTIGDLNNTSFKYKFLIDDLNKNIKLSINNSIDNYARIINNNEIEINIDEINKSQIRFDKRQVELEVAHELLHKQLTDNIIKLDDKTKVKLGNDLIDIKNRIKDSIDKGDNLNKELTDNEKALLNAFLNTINVNDIDNIDLNTLQEIITYPFTNINIARALSKINAINETNNSIKTIWDKVLDIMRQILGVKDLGIINDINFILTNSLTSLESNISNQTDQSPEIIKGNELNSNNAIKSEVKVPNSNVNVNVANRFKKKQSKILLLESDNKIVNSQKFKAFNDNNSNIDINSVLEYFKKCK